MNQLVESEVKLAVEDLDPIIAKLDAAGAELVQERVYENNFRYENAGETLTANGIVLRLRQDSRVRLTYKAPASDDLDLADGVLTRFEAEVTVDDFDVMDLILQRLGFHPYVVYEKYRTTYHLGEAEIVLDEMPYGNFVEIEGPTSAIRAALKTLELHNEPRLLTNYMALFDRVKAALNLDVHDLTFANFQNVEVPLEVFTSGE
ncbi:MAG: class IV adenylate cyclase [Chloroflexi bacterium]|nr:class IV adenylate cyclase [Chloroflexota bacterium]